MTNSFASLLCKTVSFGPFFLYFIFLSSKSISHFLLSFLFISFNMSILNLIEIQNSPNTLENQGHSSVNFTL